MSDRNIALTGPPTVRVHIGQPRENGGLFLQVKDRPEGAGEHKGHAEGDSEANGTRLEPERPGREGLIRDESGSGAPAEAGDAVVEGGGFPAEGFEDFVATARVSDEDGSRHASGDGLFQALAHLGRHVFAGRINVESIGVGNQDGRGFDGRSGHGAGVRLTLAAGSDQTGSGSSSSLIQNNLNKAQRGLGEGLIFAINQPETTKHGFRSETNGD